MAKYTVDNEGLKKHNSEGKLEKVRGPITWKDFAWTGGGAIGSYMLAKSLIGDDDDEKDKSTLKRLAPYLAAIAGGIGGYYMSDRGAGPMKKASYSFVDDDNGKVKSIDAPTGDLANGIGYTGFGIGSLSAGRAVLNHIYNDRRAASDAVNMPSIPYNRKNRGIVPYSESAARSAISARQASKDAKYLARLNKADQAFNVGASQGVKGLWNRFVKSMGTPVKGRFAKILNQPKKLLGYAVASLGVGSAAKAIGSRQSGRYEELLKDLEARGFDISDVKK